VKARHVHGLDPGGALADNVERIIAVRLDELCSFMPKAENPEKVRALHDMRIAAKRLRYLLEMFSPCFGPYAATAAKKAKALQDLLGEIHDCDVTIPRVEGLVAELRERDAVELRRAAGDAEDLEPGQVPEAPHADAFRGLESMAVHLRARRLLLFERFLELWTALRRDGFRARLEFAIGERPAPAPATDPAITPRSHDGNGSGPADHVPSPEPAP
jgi:hypothetical protein